MNLNRNRPFYKKIRELNELSPAKKIEEFKNIQSEKQNESKELKKEIEKIEDLIEKTKSHLKTSSKNEKDVIATTELKYNQLLTGDQRRLIESEVQKKEDKLKENLQSSHQSIREQNIKEQINEINKLLLEDRKNNDKLIELKYKKNKEIDSLKEENENLSKSNEECQNIMKKLENDQQNLEKEKESLSSSIKK